MRYQGKLTYKTGKDTLRE